MSCRELGDLKSMLEALNYPHSLSFGNYRIPNFSMTAEILRWLCECYGDDHDLPKDISTEKNRALFTKTAALFMYRHTGMKLNPRKLYQGNRGAVNELLRVVVPLYQANKNLSACGFQRDDDANARFSVLNNSLQEKLTGLPKQRNIMSELTEISAALYDLLSQDAEARENRSLAIAKQMDITELEALLKQAHMAMHDEIKETERSFQSLASDEQALENKIMKKQAEIDRLRKRLQQLQSVRPAYMDEYESLESQHRALYDVYVQKFRNLCYLRKLVMDLEAADTEVTSLNRVKTKYGYIALQKSEWVGKRIARQLTPPQRTEEADVLQIRKTEIRPKMFGSIAATSSTEESVTVIDQLYFVRKDGYPLFKESSNSESEEDVLIADVMSGKKSAA